MNDASASTEAVIIYSTFPDLDTAEAIGSGLVESGLAACVNILPTMRSIYRWQGSIKTDDEVVAIVKSERSRIEAIVAAIETAHPYDTPAIVVLPVVAGSDDYLDWIAAETATSNAP